MKIEVLDELLNSFIKIPKTIKEPTLLEISSYPKRRFEEISSRILSFYFAPNKEHRLSDLFISSLFELLSREDIIYKNEQIKIITEDNAEGKRIDLVIFSPDFVIGIENKITASLYNPLDVYKKRINEYSVNQRIKLVLSLHKITKKEELKLIKDNGFIAITYTELFNVIKTNIGQYIANSNQKYLTHLYDFIQTLENMKASTPIDKELYDYFFEKSSSIDDLIKSYSGYKESNLNIQKEKIEELKSKISEKTGVKWWAWQNWDLGFSEFNQNEEKPRIGIESSFQTTKQSPLGEFKIKITTWKSNDWKPYEKILTEQFPDNRLDKTSVKNRVFMHMDVIAGNDETKIIKKLSEYYSLLKTLTE